MINTSIPILVVILTIIVFLAFMYLLFKETKKTLNYKKEREREQNMICNLHLRRDMLREIKYSDFYANCHYLLVSKDPNHHTSLKTVSSTGMNLEMDGEVIYGETNGEWIKEKIEELSKDYKWIIITI